MGIIEHFVMIKDKLNTNIADEVRKLYLEGLTYPEALKKAKEIYISEMVKENE